MSVSEFQRQQLERARNALRNAERTASAGIRTESQTTPGSPNSASTIRIARIGREGEPNLDSYNVHEDRTAVCAPESTGPIETSWQGEEAEAAHVSGESDPRSDAEFREWDRLPTSGLGDDQPDLPDESDERYEEFMAWEDTPQADLLVDEWDEYSAAMHASAEDGWFYADGTGSRAHDTVRERYLAEQELLDRYETQSESEDFEDVDEDEEEDEERIDVDEEALNDPDAPVPHHFPGRREEHPGTPIDGLTLYDGYGQYRLVHSEVVSELPVLVVAVTRTERQMNTDVKQWAPVLAPNGRALIVHVTRGPELGARLTPLSLRICHVHWWFKDSEDILFLERSGARPVWSRIASTEPSVEAAIAAFHRRHGGEVAIPLRWRDVLVRTGRNE